MVPAMTSERREEAPEPEAVHGPCPTIDALVAYFSGDLMQEEEGLIRRHLAACAQCRGLACALAAEFVRRPGMEGAPAAAPLPGRGRPPARPRRIPGLLRLAAQLLLFAGAGFAIYRAVGTGEEPAPSLGTIHFSVLGDSTRRASGEPADGELEALVVAPGQELPLALSTVDDAHLWVFLATLEPDAVETIDRRFRKVSEGRTSFYSCQVPGGRELPEKSFLVALVSRAPIEEDSTEKVLKLMRSSANASELQKALEKIFRCAARVHELRVTEEREPKFGILLDRSVIRQRVAALGSRIRSGEFSAAREEAQRLFAEVEEQAGATAGLQDGSEWWEIGDARRAEQLAVRLAAATPDQQASFLESERLRAGVVASLPRLIGPTRAESGEVASLLDACRQAQEIRSRILGPDDPQTTDLLHLRAKVLLLAGADLDQAMQLLETVRVQYEEVLGRRHPRYADALNDLAGACRNKDLLEPALHYAVDSLRVYESAREDPRRVFEVLRSLSDIHARLGSVEVARSYADLARAALDSLVGDREHWMRLANFHVTNAGVHFRAGALDLAESELESAYALYREGLDPRSATTVLFRICELLLLEGKYEPASERLNTVRDSDRAFFGEDHPFLALDDFLLGIAAMGLEDWPRARDLLESALTYAEHARSGLADLQDRAAFGRYHGLESIADALSRTYCALSMPGTALEAQERGRARLVLDLLSGALGDVEVRVAGQQEDVRTFEALAEAARQRKAEAHQRVTDLLASKDGQTHAVQSEIQAGSRELALAVRDEWMAERAASSRWRRMIAEGHPAGAVELQALLGEDELLLYFAWSDTELILFLVPPAGSGGIEAHPVTEGAEAMTELASRIATTMNAVSRSPADPSAEPFVAPAQALESELIRELHALYRTLIPPAIQSRSQGVQTLYLVPDGPLDRLPFEALVTEAGARWADCRFLLDRVPVVAYLPSGSVLKYLRSLERRDPSLDSWSALLVGDPSFPAISRLDREEITLRAHAGDMEAGEVLASIRANPAGLPPLPETGHEVEIIRSILAQFGAQAELLVQDQATAANVLARAEGKRIVHIAAHGRIGDSLRPYSAGLALSVPGGSGEEEHGFLRLQDVLEHWPRKLLGCELAVLSACESGTGGAGLYSDLSLPIGFHCAGVPAVVASTWQVDSDVTVHLMCAFYDGLFGHARLRKPEALREAKRRVRSALPDPYYWAAFRYFGDPR